MFPGCIYSLRSLSSIAIGKALILVLNSFTSSDNEIDPIVSLYMEAADATLNQGMGLIRKEYCL